MRLNGLIIVSWPAISNKRVSVHTVSTAQEIQKFKVGALALKLDVRDAAEVQTVVARA